MMKLKKLKSALVKSWSKDTCYPPMGDDWSRENPALGQCYVTALIVNDYFGGMILEAKFKDGSAHFWNLVDGEEVDLTRSQFDEGEIIPEPKEFSRQEIDSRKNYDGINGRYLLLKKRINKLCD